jgi:hypothetical protein
MIAEAAQVAAEAAKQGGTITVAVPTALISSIVTILGREAIAAYFGRRKGKSGNGSGGPKPGESEKCREHGEAIAGLMTFKDNTSEALKRIENMVYRILERGEK